MLEAVKDRKEFIANFFDTEGAVGFVIFALGLVVGYFGLGLGVIGLDAVADRLLGGVVGAAFDGCAVVDALKDGLIRDHYAHDGGYCFVGFGEHLIERFGLLESSREAVQKEATGAAVDLEFVLDHAFDHFVGNEGAGIDEGFGLESERTSGSDFFTKKVSGGDVAQIVAFYECLCLGAFARTRRAE